nr:MAG TPA: hypothetical protein [Caudoviricetes sp.]
MNTRRLMAHSRLDFCTLSNICADKALDISGFAGNTVQSLNNVLFCGFHQPDRQYLCVRLVITVLRSFFPFFNGYRPLSKGWGRFPGPVVITAGNL